MRFPRSAGILVHPTSFPSPFGAGDLGPAAREFLDMLHDTHQTIWQVLPLGPTGYGYSPYASYSAFAGNPYLVSPEILADKGLLTRKEIASRTLPVTTVADYPASQAVRDELYTLASDRFHANLTAAGRKELASFRKKNAYWLDDFLLFMACGKAHHFIPWNQWAPGLASRAPEALKQASKDYEADIRRHLFLQFEFFSQWESLKAYANSLGIRIIGDIPIFVDHNSADVWAQPRFFEVDAKGDRVKVAGVPPDYFSETGQLWGNPLYKWPALAKEGYSWWIERFRQMFHLYDAIRVDHFRGFDAYWEVSASEKTAVKGTWVKGPGAKLFSTIRKTLGELPIIAEDLGFVTPSVEKLRDDFEFPGMKILQFAFDSDASNSFLPHNFPQNSVVYSGTHDNDTTIGWYVTAPEIERHRVREYTRSDGGEIQWELIRLGMLSVSDQAIFPLQDVMNLDGSHRMNLPGTVGRNWLWRYTPEMLYAIDRGRIRHLVQLGNRRAAPLS
jgi:4-alpha-glucanotransferase